MSTTQNTEYAALLSRLTLGTMFVAHALLKIMVFTPAGFAGYLTSIGLPDLLTYPTIIAEFGGGLLLIAGIQTRFISAALAPILLGSIIFAHGANGWLFSNTGGGWEFPAVLIALSGIQVLLGDGAYSSQKFFSGATKATAQ